MIALDTNVLVRLITGDDHDQSRAAEKLLRSDEGPFFLPDLVLADLVWVLQRAYGYSRPETAEVLSEILSRGDVVFEDEARVRAALRDFEEGLDFADGLILETARAFDCRRLATFDDAVAAHRPDFAVVPQTRRCEP